MSVFDGLAKKVQGETSCLLLLVRFWVSLILGYWYHGILDTWFWVSLMLGYWYQGIIDAWFWVSVILGYWYLGIIDTRVRYLRLRMQHVKITLG